MSTAEAFNRSRFSRFINSSAGRAFRLFAGMGFLVVGYLLRARLLGMIFMVFSVIPLSAGVFNFCYFSAILGGPLSSAKIRETQHQK